MKIGSFEFNLRELAGSMGDFGTLLPLAVGYFAVCGMDPAGLLVAMGLANIVTGLVFRLPMPIEPMKVLAVVAIAQGWSPSLIHASAFAMGITWLILGLSGIMTWIGAITPVPVTRGIQAALGILLALEAVKMLSQGWALGVLSLLIVVFLRNNRYAPAALVLMVLGGLMLLAGEATLNLARPMATMPRFTIFSPVELYRSMVLGGFAQIPLTATNAVIATSALISSYWPERKVTVKQLSLSMGIMNLLSPLIGGMPMCHGAGGLASQYYFGARTGGANILEGVIELCMGLFLAASIGSFFSAFPRPIIGAMLFLVGLELGKSVKAAGLDTNLIILVITTGISVFFNMALGFMAGMAAHYIIQAVKKQKTGSKKDPVSPVMKKQNGDDTPFC